MTDRELIRVHWPSVLRPAFDALFAIDDALGEVVAGSSQPMPGQYRRKLIVVYIQQGEFFERGRMAA